MRESHRLLMQTAMSDAGCSRSASHFPLQAWVTRGVLALAALPAACLIQTQDASAVPAYARQTGQTCATCHTVWPELTPFGRQFKLMGYTSGGTRCDDGSAKWDDTQVPLSVMAWPATFTNVKSKKNQADLGALPSLTDNSWLPGQFSLFVAGQYYCDVGGFAQMTFDRQGPDHFSWDLTDIRYAKTTTVDGIPLVYGATANNTPGIQDPWNTSPGGGFSFPWIASEAAPAPAAATMLAGNTWGGQVGGLGGYVWVNNMIYAELTAYGALPPQTLILLGADPTATRFNEAAPYWRVAVEKTWDKNSWMVGTFGMYAAQQPVGNGQFADALTFAPSVTNPFLDIGVDTQYQWIGEEHIVSVRASYVWEHQKFSGQYQAANGTNSTDTLNDLNINASYIYDRAYSLTVGYFATWGSKDAGLYGTATSAGVVNGFGSVNSSPDSNGWNVDVAYLPYSNGGAPLWPWFNARIGILYTHYDKFDGSSSFVDFNTTNPANLKASGNDTLFFYTWLMF